METLRTFIRQHQDAVTSALQALICALAVLFALRNEAAALRRRRRRTQRP